VQVLAQQHGGPVLGFGAAGAGLDVHEAVQRIGRIVEHAAEFQGFQAFAQGLAVGFDGDQGVVVIVGAGQFEQVAGVEQAAFQAAQRPDDVFQGFLFASQILGVLRVVPDVGAFQFGIDDEQAFGLGIVVKDTSGEWPGAPDSPRCGC
jgi:hypothetical protein